MAWAVWLVVMRTGDVPNYNTVRKVLYPAPSQSDIESDRYKVVWVTPHGSRLRYVGGNKRSAKAAFVEGRDRPEVVAGVFTDSGEIVGKFPREA